MSTVHQQIANIVRPYTDKVTPYIEAQEEYVKVHGRLSKALCDEMNKDLAIMCKHGDDSVYVITDIPDYDDEICPGDGLNHLVFTSNFATEYLLRHILEGNHHKFKRENCDAFVNYVYTM